MAKSIRIKVGDIVKWDGSPNELSNNLHGTVIAIRKGMAYISHPYQGSIDFAKTFGGNFIKMSKASHLRQVPVNKLRLIKC